MSGWIQEREQEDTTEQLIHDNAKGGNPNINLVIERAERMDCLMY